MFKKRFISLLLLLAKFLLFSGQISLQFYCHYHIEVGSSCRNHAFDLKSIYFQQEKICSSLHRVTQANRYDIIAVPCVTMALHLRNDQHVALILAPLLTH